VQAHGAQDAPLSPTIAPVTPAEAFVPPATDREVLTLDDEMRRYFSARIDPNARTEARLEQMIAVIRGDLGSAFAYEGDGTYDAKETFHRHRGNCVSFSLLVVAVARAYGLRAEFHEVNTYQQWAQDGDFILTFRHLNVKVREGGNNYVVDILPKAERNAPVRATRGVSDLRAFAHFYNNLAVMRLRAGDRHGAMALFDRALAADSTAGFVWANKGNTLMALGKHEDARICLERALKEDPEELSANNSLVRLYRETNQPKLADRYEKQAQRYRMRNPYYLLSLAKTEFANGKDREADAHLRQAIAIKDDAPEFYQLRIQVAQRLGRSADAARWTLKVEELRTGGRKD
jgi:tetratricopeptide (TPR) repeat protein